MKRSWLMVLAVILTVVLVGLLARAKFFPREGPGALQIVSNPRAVVFLDGQRQEEMTPYLNKNLPAGEHVIQLVPETDEQELVNWETKIKVVPNILTSVTRDLAPTEASSAGEILSLEKVSNNDSSSLAVISMPDEAVIRVDGTPRGFAPTLVDDLAVGEHEVVVSSPGYKERTILATTLSGYKLTIEVKLAQEAANFQSDETETEDVEEQEATDEAEPDEDQSEEEKNGDGDEKEEDSISQNDVLEKPYIKVKETPTGWLRVRESPSTVSEELAKIETGETYPYLEEETNGWYKIEYEEGEEGWVSGVYVDLIE